MPVNRYYSSTAQETALTVGINSSATNLAVGGTTGFPVQFPYTLILDRGTASEELVEVTSAVGTNLTATRGVDGTSAVSHSLGATVVHGASGRDHREAQEHLAASSGVHGVTGSVVGTTDTQTLSNKTLSNPTVNGGTWASPVFTGQPTLSDFTNAQHDHTAANKGGSVPQSAVTGLASALSTLTNADISLDSRLDTAEATITSQGSTLTSHDSTLTSHTASIASNTTAITTLHTPPYASLKRTSDQVILDSTPTQVQWNSEVEDTHGGHDNSTNNTRYTAPVAGVYLLTVSIPWKNNVSEAKFETSFRRNGSTNFIGTGIHKDTSNVTIITAASRMIRLAASDYVEIMVWQTSSGGRIIDSTFDSGPLFEIIWLRD